MIRKYLACGSYILAGLWSVASTGGCGETTPTEAPSKGAPAGGVGGAGGGTTSSQGTGGAAEAPAGGANAGGGTATACNGAQSVRLGSSGPGGGNDIRLASNGGGVVAVWRTFNDFYDASVLVQSVALGEQPKGEPSVVVQPSSTRHWKAPAIAPLADGQFIVSWDAKSGPSDLDQEVWGRTVTAAGAPSTAEATILRSKTESMLNGSPIWASERPVLLTAGTNDTDPKTAHFEYRIATLSANGAASDGTWPFVDLKNRRLVPLDNGYAAIYEGEAGGVFFTRLTPGADIAVKGSVQIGTTEGLDGFVRGHGDRFVIGQEDYALDDKDNLVQYRIGFDVFDDAGNTVAEVTAVQPAQPPTDTDALVFVDALVVGEEVHLFWGHSYADKVQNQRFELSHARYALETGAPLGAAPETVELDAHLGDYKDGALIDPEVRVVALDEGFAVAYGINSLTPPVGSGSSELTEYYLQWICPTN